MLPTWANDTVTRIRPGVISRRGSEEPDWSNPDELIITGCSMQPAGTSLSQDGRVLGISDAWTCYFPTGSDIQAGDKIVYDGKEFQIIGEIRKWISPTGRVSNLQAELERWSG